MAKIEIIISDDNGTVMSMFELTEANAVGDVTNIQLADEVMETLSNHYNVSDK